MDPTLGFETNCELSLSLTVSIFLQTWIYFRRRKENISSSLSPSKEKSGHGKNGISKSVQPKKLHIVITFGFLVLFLLFGWLHAWCTIQFPNPINYVFSLIPSSFSMFFCVYHVLRGRFKKKSKAQFTYCKAWGLEIIIYCLNWFNS